MPARSTLRVSVACSILSSCRPPARPDVFTFFFFFNETTTTEIYTLSLHDALPISRLSRRRLVRRHVHREHHVRGHRGDRKSTRLNSSHANISYAVFCLKKKTI